MVSALCQGQANVRKSTASIYKDGTPYEYTKHRLKQLGLWTLEERRHRADLLEMFKMLIGKSTLFRFTLLKEYVIDRPQEVTLSSM